MSVYDGPLALPTEGRNIVSTVYEGSVKKRVASGIKRAREPAGREPKQGSVQAVLTEVDQIVNIKLLKPFTTPKTPE